VYLWPSRVTRTVRWVAGRGTAAAAKALVRFSDGRRSTGQPAGGGCSLSVKATLPSYSYPCGTWCGT
jgi:hypothetical protein